MADHFTSDQFGRGRKIRVAGAKMPRAHRAGRSTAGFYGLVSFVPFVSFLAMWQGLKSLDPRNDLALSSRIIGVVVILVSLVFTAVHVLIGFRGYEYYRAVQTGPETAFVAARDGGPDAFGATFEAELTPPKAFLRVMEDRYGAFVASERIREEHDWMTWFEAPSTPRSYLVHFERGDMEAEISIALIARPGGDWLKSRLARFEILDERRGNIVFPGTAKETRVATDEDVKTDEVEDVADQDEIAVETEVATTGS